MKIIYSEYLANYKTYSYAYGIYAILENLKSEKEISEIYTSGFLPYSGSADLLNYFYLCRSLRVNLSNWKLNSENKRVQKKQVLDLQKKVFKSFPDLEKEEGKKAKEELFDFYLNYFKKIHGEKIMSQERLKFIFEQKFVNRIIVYRDQEENLVGSILMVEGGKHLHFWFSAYSQSMEKTGFGLWMMLNEIQESIKRKLNYFYLGTCYGEKAKYKLNFESLEFFDGASWNQDLKELKERLKKDSEKDKEFDLLKAKKGLF